MRSSSFRYWWRVGLIVSAVLLAGIGAVSFAIGRQVAHTVSHAQSMHPGDPVEALMAVASSADSDLGDRNRAVWALGQLGATKALPVLESMVTGSKCVHEEQVCQREVGKAIEGCSGAFNPGAVVWRHGELASR